MSDDLARELRVLKGRVKHPHGARETLGMRHGLELAAVIAANGPDAAKFFRVHGMPVLEETPNDHP